MILWFQKILAVWPISFCLAMERLSVDFPAKFPRFPCIETEDMEPKEVKRRQKLCSRALRHLQRAHEKLMALRAQGMELPPSKQYQFLEDHPELSGLPREMLELHMIYVLLPSGNLT